MDLDLDKIYKIPRQKGGYYYILPNDQSVKIYLSHKYGFIFSESDEDYSLVKLKQMIKHIGDMQVCEIDEEAKVRMLINIFHEEAYLDTWN